MGLNLAHKGYEYQDLLTVYFILNEIINGYNSNFIVDRKLHKGDVFDDLTIEREGILLKKQIKYSEEHTLQKKDLSANSYYQLAIDNLYNSWQKNKNSDIRLCLAWNEPTDELVQILFEKSGIKTFTSHETKIYQINIDKFWPKGEKPLKQWKKFNESSQNIDRNDFADFCDKLYIETNFPKFSMDLASPGELEEIVLQQADKLGIGVFPNHHITDITFIDRLLLKVKQARSNGDIITSQSIFIAFNIKTDYGSIDQHFPIDQQKNIITKRTIDTLITDIQTNKRELLLGEPGSGKSWLVNNLTDIAKNKNIHVVKHFCYTDLNDQLQEKRIQQNTLFGNLISDILKEFPKLSKKKKQKYASTLSELNLLVQSIKEPTIIIIDGLDHIDRAYEFYSYADLSKNETQIIDFLEKIEHTDNVSILLASQPISKLNKIKGFHKFQIPKWNKHEVNQLLKKYNIRKSIVNKTDLSQVLLDKCEGNPLYLTYLIKELQKAKKINKDFIDNLPVYSYNLAEYYNYILAKLNTRESLPRILSGVNFYLSKNELKEITGDGDYIEEILESLSPILRTNVSLDGYIIYHESFRRFVINTLNGKKVSVERNVFGPTIEWFKTKNIYSYAKFFRYGLQFLYTCHQYKEIERYVIKEFIVDSVTWGQPWKLIKNNVQIFSKVAVLSHNLSLIVIVNELFKTIGSTENYYNTSFISYIECMGLVRGFDMVTNFLSFEGEPALDDLLQGLQACYLSSNYGKTAPWNLYIGYFKRGENIKLEDFKYYVRYFIEKEDTPTLIKIAKSIKKRRLVEFKKVFIHEIKSIVNSVYKVNLLNKDQIIEVMIKKNSDFVNKNLLAFINNIKSIKGFTEEDVCIVENFILQCDKQILDNSLIKEIVKDLEGINWFYNWLIYCVKIASIKQKKRFSFYDVKDAFTFLVSDTDPFKGEPRTCDLYYFENLILETIKAGLRLLNKKEEWKEIIDMLLIVNNKTSVTLQGSLGGPLSTDKLFIMFYDIVNENNIDYIIEKSVELYDEEKNYCYFSYLSDYCFVIAKLYILINKKDIAESYFYLGARYMVSYTWRRDTTLFEPIDCLAFLPQMDLSFVKDAIKRTYELSESVINHTDGKDTKWLPTFWFKEYVKVDSFEASVWLLNQLYKTRYSWYLEKDLLELLYFLKGQINPVLEQFILSSFITENRESFIRATINVNKKIMGKNSLLAVSFAKKISVRLQNGSLSTYSDILNQELSSHFSFFNIDYSLIQKSYADKRIDLFKNNQFNYRTKEFSDMTLAEMADFIKEENLTDLDLHSLVYVFDDLPLNEETKQIVKDCVIGRSRYRFNNEFTLKRLDILFEANRELKIYYDILVFIWVVSGNGSAFYLKDKFIEAYQLDPEKSIEYLFELLPIIFHGTNKDFSANLLNAIATTENKFKDKIVVAVKNLIECIEYKIPIFEEFDWKSELENEFNMNLEEILISILLTRAKAYTTERLVNTLSAITVLLNKAPEKLIKPLKWFFGKQERYKESVILCILDILYEYDKTNPNYISNFQMELEKMYPKRYYLIDCLLERFLNKNPCSIILPSQLQFYPLNEGDLEIFLKYNYRLRNLYEIGIDVTSVIFKHQTIYLQNNADDLDLYTNRVYSRYVKNIYPSNYILERINTDLYDELRAVQDNSNDDCYEFLRINTKLLIAQGLSYSLRPKDLMFPSQGKQSEEKEQIQSNDGWVRLAHYEKELYNEEHFDLKERHSCGTVLPNATKDTSLILVALYDSEKYSWATEDGVLLEFIQHDPLENYHLFWLNPIIMKELAITTGGFLNGISGYNEKGEIVLKYNQWKSNYIGNGDYGIIDEIPRIEGAELIIREDYFKKLQLILNKDLTQYSILFQHFLWEK